MFRADSDRARNSCNSSLSRSSSSADPTVSDADGADGRVSSRVRQGSVDNYWDMTPEQEKYYTEQFLILQPDINGMVRTPANCSQIKLL